MDTDVLIRIRELLLKEAVECFSADPAVLGVFLSGLLAAGAADAFSDIDLRVVVTPEAHARFVANRLETPKRWNGFLFNEWMEGAHHCVSHFRPFVKIDVFYYSRSALRPSPWYTLPTTILYDPEGIVRDVVEASEPFQFQVDKEKLDWLLSKGLAAAHEVYRRAERGELIYAQALLEEFRSYVVQADDWIHRRTPTVPQLKLEKRLTPALLDTLKESYVASDAGAIKAALLRVLRHYREHIIAIHGTYDLSRPLENDLYAVSVLLDS